MKVYNLSDMKGGWIVGDFEPSVLRTPDFEVGVKLHPKGEKWPVHYHKDVVEYNVLVSGSMTIQGERLEAGTIFVLDKNEIADPEFHEDCWIVCTKVPSIPGDKHEITE